MASSDEPSRKRPAESGCGGADEPPLDEPRFEPRTTLCDVVHFVAMNGFEDAVARCVDVCKSMRTNAELWERVVNVQHREFGRDADYETTRLIHWAREGDLVRVRETLDRGARVNACDTAGLTALYYAGGGQDGFAVVSELVARGATLHQWCGIHDAARSGDTAVVRDMIARGADVNARDHYGRTPLVHARREGHAATVAELRRLGATQRPGL